MEYWGLDWDRFPALLWSWQTGRLVMTCAEFWWPQERCGACPEPLRNRKHYGLNSCLTQTLLNQSFPPAPIIFLARKTCWLALSEVSVCSGKPGMHPSSDSRSCCSIVHVPADTQINGLTWFQELKSVCGRGFVTKCCQNILPDSNKLNLHYNLTLLYPSPSCQVWQHNVQESAAQCRKKHLAFSSRKFLWKTNSLSKNCWKLLESRFHIVLCPETTFFLAPGMYKGLWAKSPCCVPALCPLYQETQRSWLISCDMAHAV